MNVESRGQVRWSVSGIVLLGTGLMISAGAKPYSYEDGPPALEGPVAKGELLPESPPAADANRPEGGPLHEVFLAAGSNSERVRAPKSPPPPIVERPTDDSPGGQAQWVAGYWTWDPARDNFVWVSGAWRVTPADKLWVNGRWQRDAQGWSRVPGFWSPRRGPVVATSLSRPDPSTAAPVPAPTVAPTLAPSPFAENWRTTGPPADRPADEPGQAPDPDAFYVPGHYAPEGDRVDWKPGFWARSRPGWDWLPARVRRPAGWDYREGGWVRDPDSTTAPDQRHTVARPSTDSPSLPPAIVESEPLRPEAANDRRPPAPPPVDPIAEAEDAARANGPAVEVPPVVVVPPYGYRPPYGYPAPNGYYRPVNPRANIPFGLMPPFARRILNRVLP